jgi:hypothetical protein
VNIEYFGEFGTLLSHRTFEYLDQPGMVYYVDRLPYDLLPSAVGRYYFRPLFHYRKNRREVIPTLE